MDLLLAGHSFAPEGHLYLLPRVFLPAFIVYLELCCCPHRIRRSSDTAGTRTLISDSGPFLFPTAYAASQWTEHLQGAEMFMLDSSLEKELLSNLAFLGPLWL